MSIKKRCCSAMLAATMLSGVITQASAVGTEVLFENNISDGTDPIISEVVIPAQITLQMDKTGAVSVKEKDLKLSNTSQTSKATVKKISVVGKQGFSIADYSSDLESKPEGTKEVALQFNGDGTTSSGDVVLTSNWEIEPSNDKVLTINAKMPKQPADFEVTGGIATINWEIDTQSTVITPDQSTIDDNWTKDKVLKTSVTPVTFSYDSTNPSTTLQNVESSNPDIVSVTDAGAGASFGNEQTANYNVQALAVGRSTITATLSTGESTQFDVEVYELDIPGSSGDGTTGEIAVPEVPGKGDGDKIETGDVTIDIPITTPDGDDTITVTPEIPEDTVLSEGENTIEVDVEVDGVTVHITIVINIEVSNIENPSNGMEQSVAEAQAMGFTFSSYEDGLQIDSFENKQFKSEINVPEQIGDFKVLKIENGVFQNQTNLKKVTLPDTVTVIGDSAFAGCTNLQAIVASQVTYIGNSAFFGCSNATSFSIANATNIGNEAFSNCTSITKTIEFNNDVSYGTGVYKGCTGLKTATIAGSTTQIPKQMFSGCSNLETIEYSTLNNIGSEAFKDCVKLKEIILSGESITCSKSAFTNCPELVVYVDGNINYELNTFDSIKHLLYKNESTESQNFTTNECAMIAYTISADVPVCIYKSTGYQSIDPKYVYKQYLTQDIDRNFVEYKDTYEGGLGIFKTVYYANGRELDGRKYSGHRVFTRYKFGPGSYPYMYDDLFSEYDNYGSVTCTDGSIPEIYVDTFNTNYQRYGWAFINTIVHDGSHSYFNGYEVTGWNIIDAPFKYSKASTNMPSSGACNNEIYGYRCYRVTFNSETYNDYSKLLVTVDTQFNTQSDRKISLSSSKDTARIIGYGTCKSWSTYCMYVDPDNKVISKVVANNTGFYKLSNCYAE